MSRIVTRSIIAIVAVLALYVIVAATLVMSPAPTFTRTTEASSVPRQACAPAAGVRCIRMKDGAQLAARTYEGSRPGTTIVLVHGIMSSSAVIEPMAVALRDSTGSRVIAIDLRGHGLSDGNRGDVDYVGQYEADIGSVITTLRREASTQRIVLAGHSMGGGIAMRYAANGGFPEVDGYLLFAPHLGPNSPTTRTRPAPQTTAMAAEPMMKLHLRRIIGLMLLNSLGISTYDDLPALFFNTPRTAGHYSYRAMISAYPADHRSALTADSKPLLILAGSNDEAFIANEYGNVVTLHAGGKSVLVADATHDSIKQSPMALAAASEWLKHVGSGEHAVEPSAGMLDEQVATSL